MLWRTRNARKGAAVAAKACADAAALRAKRPAADNGERERRRQMRGTAAEEAAEAIIAPPSSAAPTQRKKRARVVWGAAHDAVLAQIDASRRTQVSSQLWASARAAAASIVQQVEARAGRKRAAEGREGDDDARARVRQRASGGMAMTTT